MQLSIIIVNYKTPELLQDCLTGLFQHTAGIAFEVIVVDNHSQDNTSEMLTGRFPSVRFVQMGYNSGFARANNEGIRKAQGDVILLLNSDTLITDNCIGIVYNKLVQSRFAACGVQLLNADGSPQISGNYVMKGGLNYLLPLPYVGAFLRSVALMMHAKKTNVPDAKGTVEVDWINGAFLMVKKEAIAVAGLLDEDFFLYAEEAEWCSRLKKHAQVCIYGDEHIVHLQGASANETFNSTGQGYMKVHDRKGLQIMLSNLLRIRKEFGAGWLLFNYFFFLLTIPVALMLLCFQYLLLMKHRISFGEWVGFSRNVLVLSQFIPRMLAGKPYFYKVL